jgi:Ca2+-binding RTX toxin-like protein
MVVTVVVAMLLPAGAAQAHHRIGHAGTGATVCDGNPVTPGFEGTDGPETINGTSAAEVIVAWGGDDIIYGGGGNDVICGGSGNDLIYGEAGHDNIAAGSGNDTVNAGSESDYILGSAGDDTIDGGTNEFGVADEVWYWDAPAPGVGGYGVDLDLALTPTMAFATHGTDTLTNVEGAAGSPFDDQLRGDGSYNSFFGDAGVDLLDGRGGSDKLYGGQGNDTLYGGADNDGLNGNEGDDQLFGEGDNDRLEGEAGADHMEGAFGFDYVDYFCTNLGGPLCSGSTTGQIVDLEAGTASGGHGDDTFTGVEGVRGTKFDDTLYGRTVNDSIYGDYFWPGFGNDTVDGRDGPDYVEYSVYADDPGDDCTNGTRLLSGITLTLESGPGDEVTGYQGTDQLDNIEHAIGSPRKDRMTGSVGNNDLWGGCGADVMYGGGGADNIAGSQGDDVVAGEDGDDRLIGGDDDDALLGGDGNDLVSFDAADNGVTVHLGAGTAQGEGEDGITSVEAIVGSAFNDVLVGGEGPELLIGGAGADDLWGRGDADRLLGNGSLAQGRADGVDRLYGGAGVDTADYSRAEQDGPWTVDANLAANPVGTVAEGAATDLVSGVEALKGSAFADRLRGDAARNYLLGGAGADDLFGGGARDYLDGQAGKDDYVGGSGLKDTVDFGTGANTKVVADLVTGNATVNQPVGDPFTESLAGVEVVAGTSGNDQISGGPAAEYLAGEGGNDTLAGRGGDDLLYGGTGTDALFGATGTDLCFDGETRDSCAVDPSDPSAPSGWYDENVAQPREFTTTGDDDLITDIEAILEDLRRLHRRRLHR